MTTISPNPAMQDLKITFHESTLVFPSRQTEGKALFLSSIDQIPNYKVPTAFFFARNPDYTPETVAKKLKSAVEKVLVPYDFMAGRLRLNSEDRLEIDCNAAGAGFVVAASEFTLAEIGDLVCPNLGFRQLAVQRLDNLGLDSDDDQPLFILQLTSFKCGGIAIGMPINHILLDGLSAKIFYENLASQAFEDKPLAVVPCFDRSLLAARSPPQVAFPHPEFFKPAAAPTSAPPVFDCEIEELEYRVFKLTPTDINFLKKKAKSPNNQPNIRISSFSAASALIWRCKALSFGGDEQSKGRISVLLSVVDLRSRLTDPSLPAEYCGNAVWAARSAPECGDLENWAFSKIVEIVAEAPGKIAGEYARSALDWLEVNKGLPCGEYMVTSWLRLGFGKVAYPWGTPVHSGPVVSHRKDICWIFPTADGVNAMVSLPAAEMERFESLFHSFFRDNSSINQVH